MAPQAFGKYQLLRKLATGGMAEVFLARQTGIEGFNRLCVVKRILPHLAEDAEFVEMFLNEARIAARFSHPNIGQLFDLGAHEGTYFIAMEYIHGEDLGAVMRKAWADGKWVEEPLALRIIASCCAGLSYAHNRTDEGGRPLKVVHRDISPQNILISFDGSVKLVDFGIAKAADMPSLTRSGAIKGKFAYMAPEQAAGKPLDHRSDLFAIALVLYELLTGIRPLKKDNEIATLQAALECAIPPPSEVAELSPALDPVVMRALAKSPDRRYGDARELQLALEEHLLRTQKIATSVHLAEMMRDLFGDRLAQEARSGQPEPPSEPSDPGAAPPPEAPVARTRARPPSRIPAAAEVSRSRLTAETAIARSPSRPDQSGSPAGAGVKTRTAHGEEVAMREEGAPGAPPGRSRGAAGAPRAVGGGRAAAPWTGGTQNTVVPGMPEAPPRRAGEPLHAATVTPWREKARDGEAGDAPAGDVAPPHARPRRWWKHGLAASVAAVAGVCGVLLWEPLLATVRGAGVDPDGVYVTVEANLPVRVFVEHHASERAEDPREELTYAETSRAERLRGAHLRDVVILENAERGVRHRHELKFGSPGQEVVIRKEFRSGRVSLQLQPPVRGVRVHVDGAPTRIDPALQFELLEGPHTLELRGDALEAPVTLEVTVLADRTVSPTVLLPLARRN